MGNESITQSKHKLSQYKLPTNYYQNCHPNLLDLNIDQTYPYLLSAYITPNIQTSKWLSMIQNPNKSKYIFTPNQVIPYSSMIEHQSCKNQDLIDKIKVFLSCYFVINIIQIMYEPYIYSLSCEINTRRRYNKMFTQTQLWKLLKYLTKMLISWHQLHPTQRVSTITPQNIIFNYKGNLRIITQYSFPKPSYHSHPYPIYIAPSDRISSIIKYSQQNNNINKFKILSDDLYCIGMVILDCVLMEKINNLGLKVDKLNCIK